MDRKSFIALMGFVVLDLATGEFAMASDLLEATATASGTTSGTLLPNIPAAKQKVLTIAPGTVPPAPKTPIQLLMEKQAAIRSKYAGRHVNKVSTSKKLVAITWDDGPNYQTKKIVSLTEGYGGKVTFFITNRLLNQPGCSYRRSNMKWAAERGHEIANHTDDHKPLTAGSVSGNVALINDTNREVKELVGYKPVWVRGMGGGINSAGLAACKQQGNIYTNWNIDSYDSHRRYTPPDTIYRNVVSSIRPGSVILLHVTHEESIAAYPKILKWMKDHDYKTVTMSELAAAGTPTK